MISTKSINDHQMEITKNLPMREIKIGDKPYLQRYYVGQNLRREQTWLHRFLSADGDRHFHSHPWYADSMIICGGYTEESAPISNFKRSHIHRFNPSDRNIINPDTLHRITQIDKYTWTVMQVHPNWGTWYFIDEDGTKKEMGKTHGEDWWMDYRHRE